MNILIIGSGGREHSLALKLSQSPKVNTIFIAPGNAGTAQVGTNVPLSETEFEELVSFSKKNNVDLTIVGPELPLVKGIVPFFEQHHLAIVGPNPIAAQLESSKAWAKHFMKKYNIPTASYSVFTDPDTAISHIKNQNVYPIVIKADGLASGKGVTIAKTEEEAMRSIEDCLLHNRFSIAGHKIVVEDFLEGEEASVLAFCDGDTILPLESAQDHKAIYEGDKGPNTGGMGAYSPALIVTEEIKTHLYKDIFLPTLCGLKEEKIEFRGILYAGLMLSKNKAYVVEFNVRFGDPETQVLLPRLKTDLVDIFQAIVNKNLHSLSLTWEDKSSVCVVLASEGYPGSFQKDKRILISPSLHDQDGVQIVHAGTYLDGDNLPRSSGGRVLGVVALKNTLSQAISQAYDAVEHIQFENKYYRKDIGAKAISR